MTKDIEYRYLAPKRIIRLKRPRPILHYKDICVSGYDFLDENDPADAEMIAELEYLRTAFVELHHKPKNARKPRNKAKHAPNKSPINPRRKDEKKHWALLQDRIKYIRANIEDVINGESTGFYLAGRGGTSKTWLVKQIFGELCPNGYDYRSGGTTTQGLFEALEENSVRQSNRHIIYDDIYELLDSKRSRQYLLAALNHQKPRIITYQKQKDKVSIEFDKGIVMISNVELSAHSSEVIGALKTRIHSVNYSPTDEEVWAQIYHLADNSESPKEHLEVADFLYDICKEHSHRPDLRLYMNLAMGNYRSYHKSDNTDKLHWKDRIIADVTENAATVIHTVQDKKIQAKQDAQAAWDSSKIEKERGDEWERLRKGKKPCSRASVYRYWRELGLS